MTPSAASSSWPRPAARPRPPALPALAGLVALMVGALDAQAGAQPRPPSQEAIEATALSVARAFDERLTIWQGPDGRRTYAAHCRVAPGGCRARIALYSRLIAQISRDQDVDPFLVAAVVLRESGLNPFAEGSVGERGIVQLHPQGAGRDVEFVQSEPYRRRCRSAPDTCQGEVLRVGVALLANAIRRCGGVEEGLGMYNEGTCGSTSYSRRVLTERSRLLELAKHGAPEDTRHGSH